jgi:threonine dehydratase
MMGRVRDTNRIRPPRPAKLRDAAETVGRHLVPTPVVATDLLPRGFLKLETFQPTGSFKVRGALAALTALPPGVRAITASAGNHGLGMAYAAGVLGRDVTVVIAGDASPAKVDALRAFPVEVVQHGSGYDAAEHHALELAADGGVFVSGYNDVDVIAGQASLGREVGDQLPGPLTIVCPVGGGGLCAGLSLWAGTRDDVEVRGVEVEQSRAVSAAVAAGRTVPVTIGETIADGLAGNIDDPCVTPSIIDRHTAGLAAVSEDELRAAMRWLFQEHGLVVEGAGAVGVAAVLAGKLDIPRDRQVAVVLTGRNITRDRYADVLQ